MVCKMLISVRGEILRPRAGAKVHYNVAQFDKVLENVCCLCVCVTLLSCTL